MSIFGQTNPVALEILDRINDLSEQVAKLEGERKAAKEGLKLASEITTLKKELTNLEIEKDRVEEQHKREKREVEHMVGLERKRQEFEVDSAKRDVTLAVREENLSAQQDRFEEQIKFIQEQFDGQIDYIKTLMTEMVERLPVVRVDRKISDNGDELTKPGVE